MLIYLAGTYSENSDGTVDDHIALARKVACKLWEKGHAVICPHLNTARFELDCKITWQDYMNGDLNILSRCDALVLLPNWKNSKGATLEYEYARDKLQMKIYEYPDIPALHPTELNAPIQSEGFRIILRKMNEVHLDKNADYSSSNILMTGQIGLVTRLWDKVARLLNLTGFRLRIFTRKEISKAQPVAQLFLVRWYESAIHWLARDEKFVRFDGYVEEPRKPKHESIEDTLYDLSVYGIIGLLLRRNQWGR